MNELNITTTISITNKYLAFPTKTIIFCGNKISRVTVPSSSRICERIFRWLVRYEKAENHESDILLLCEAKRNRNSCLLSVKKCLI